MARVAFARTDRARNKQLDKQEVLSIFSFSTWNVLVADASGDGKAQPFRAF